MGRDVKHWWTQGAKLLNKLHDAETPWGKYLTKLYLGESDGEKTGKAE